MRIIDWRVCSHCLEACEYCFAYTGRKRVNQEQESIILKKIIASGIESVNITGGEPMLEEKRCLKIIDELWKAGKNVYLSTNGYHVEENLQWLQGKISLLGLPLDGWDESANMVCGRSRLAFSTVMGILRHPLAKEINIKIGTVVTKKNLAGNYLDRLSRLLDYYPVNIWRIYEVLPENRGEKNKDELVPDEVGRQELYRQVQQIRQRNHLYHTELVTRDMRNSNYMIIQPDGSAMVPMDTGERVNEYELGSLLNLSLQEITQRWMDMTCGHIDEAYSTQRLKDAAWKIKEEESVI